MYNKTPTYCSTRAIRFIMEVCKNAPIMSAERCIKKIISNTRKEQVNKIKYAKEIEAVTIKVKQ